MPRLRRVLVAALVGLLAPVLTHAHYQNNPPPPPPPPDDIDGAAEEILNVVSGFYAVVAVLESGGLDSINSEVQDLSERLRVVAGRYEDYAAKLGQGTALDKSALPDNLRNMVTQTFTSSTATSRILRTDVSEPGSDAEVFGQAAVVLNALAGILSGQSDRMTSQPDLTGLRQFMALNSAVAQAVHIMALHSALLRTAQ